MTKKITDLEGRLDAALDRADKKVGPTAGPWRMKQLSDRLTINGPEGCRIATLTMPLVARNEANARLIATVPDLLRIAKWAVTMLQAGGKPDQCCFDEANTIIAKAEAGL